MFLFAMKNTTLDVHIINPQSTVPKTISINRCNVSSSCNQLLYAHKKTYSIKHTISWESLKCKSSINLIFDIGFELILKSSNFVDLLINHQYKSSSQEYPMIKILIEIYNLEFFINIMFYNNLIIKKIFSDESKWKPLIMFFKRMWLYQKKQHLQSKYDSLALLLGKSQRYWNLEHYKYMVDIRFEKALLHSVYISFYHCKISTIITVTYTILQNCKRQFIIEEDNHEIWLDFQNKIEKETKKYRRKFNNKLKRSNYSMNLKRMIKVYDEFVDDYLVPVPVLMTSKPPKFYCATLQECVKPCAYNKCKNMKYIDSESKIKMKICKGCKLIYYCSRKCQKCDWNSRHRYQCLRLN